MDGIRLYIKESYNELIHNVTWPTWPELFSATWLVLIATVILAILVVLMDLLSKTITTGIYNL